MLGKLFRYEMKYSAPTILLLHIAALIVSLLLTGIDKLAVNPALYFFFRLFQIGGILLILGTALYTYFSIGMRFYKTVFSRQGYLTNTLPVTSGQILLSRFLSALIWCLLDGLFVILSLSLACGINLFQEFPYQFGQDPDIDRFLGILGVLILISLIVSITSILCSVAIGNLFTGHKIIGTLIALFALQAAGQILSLIPLLFHLDTFLSMPSGNYDLIEFELKFSDGFHAMISVFEWECIIYILLSVFFYFLTWYLMDRKLNLE